MIDYKEDLDLACEKFRKILEAQLKRVEDMKAQGGFLDYAALPTIKIGVCGGDGIGPIISAEAERVLAFMLDDLVKAGKVEFRTIDGLTIENRIAKNNNGAKTRPIGPIILKIIGKTTKIKPVPSVIS